jgi:hypothetical protein
MLIRKIATIFAGVLIATQVQPACAQSLTYFSTARSDQGATFKLVIHRTGNTLRFEIAVTAAATSLDGTPFCDSTDVDQVGHFKTWCSRFQAQEPGRTPLEGNLNQLTAQVGPIFRFGTARFQLDPFKPGSFPGR